MIYRIKPIGIVNSVLKTLDDCPRQEDEGAPGATIEIFTEYLDAASHITTGDTLVVLTWLDQANRGIMKTHPRNDRQTALTGVFSTRSPDRPNPIGLHEVRILSIESKSKFRVSALEVLDGTPIIDIKSTR